jgi:hypothetical protein
MDIDIRRVRPGWEHPRNEKSEFVALEACRLDQALSDWNEQAELRDRGLYMHWTGEVQEKEEGHMGKTYEEWAGPPPRPERYMPTFQASDAKLFQIYKDGTPFSPRFAMPEELVRWAVDNRVERCGHRPSYEQWLRYCL